MKAFLSLMSALCLATATTASAQDFDADDYASFLDAADELVFKGHQQYMRSYRPGIKLYADSLEHLLQSRHQAGLLSPTDSAGYTAYVLKLRGDWHYENSHYDTASYAQAEAFFRQALEIYRQNSALSELTQAPMAHRELAQLYYKQERYAEALAQTDSALVEYDNRFKEDGKLFSDYMSETQFEDYWSMQSQRAMCLARLGSTAEASEIMDVVLAALKEHGTEGQAYYEALRKKAKIIMLSGQKDCEKKAIGLYRRYSDWVHKDALATLATMTVEEREGYWMRMRPFVADCYQIEAADPAFLYDVTLFSKGLLLQINRFSGRGKSSTRALNSLSYTWTQIQQKLPANGCAIEFVQYEKHGQQAMAALVLKKTGRPTWVPMLSPDDFLNYTSFGKTNRERIYNTNGSVKNALYNDSTFFAQIWNADLRKVLRGCKKIYFAPDGYLHQVAIEYMLPDELAQADVYRLSSTRRLMENGRVRTDAALIVGGVVYNTPVESEADGNDSVAYEYLQSNHLKSLGNYLDGSKAEVDSIRCVRAVARDTLLSGSSASEEAFRQLCGRYPIVAISTHGYFGAAQVPQGTDVKTCLSDESMSQSVLALAGANASLGNASFDSRHMDGILSARELSSINMENVDLVVVSACETALGYVTSDGIYGIQRGLKNAGADCLLVSLWDVNDEATCLLMSRFHRYLRGGMTVHRAFLAARRSLIAGEEATDDQSGMRFNASTMTYKRHQTTVAYDKPMYSDAFILIDAIE